MDPVAPAVKTPPQASEAGKKPIYNEPSLWYMLSEGSEALALSLPGDVNGERRRVDLGEPVCRRAVFVVDHRGIVR